MIITGIPIENDDKEAQLNNLFLSGDRKIMGVYKFPNGNIATFGYNEEQIPMLQGPYSKELEAKIKEYSDEKTIWKGFG